MLDKFLYESHDQKYIINFGEDGIYINENDVRGYSWNYLESNNQITAFQHNLVDKKLPIMFIGKTHSDMQAKRDHVFRVFERDVKSQKQGRIWINGYYLSCYIFAAENSGHIHPRFLISTFTIVTDGIWRKESLFQFLRLDITPQASGIDHPYDFPHDLGFSTNRGRQVIKNDCIVNSDFVLTIYGPCFDPLVEIAGHTYKINGTVSSTERLVITSVENQKHTIVKYAEDGSASDWFGRRYKEESVFEKIPEGNIAIVWNGTFGFELALVESRSEPVWYIASDEPVEDTEDIYLLDADGAYILDSDGAYIEVTA